MEPSASSIHLPEGYGTPDRVLAWERVHRRLEDALQYWLVTTRPDGRPHVVPVDGLWKDDRWYFGGDPDTVHERNLRHNPHVAIHLPDPVSAVIVEGKVERVTADAKTARELAAASKSKYGYGPPASVYQGGVSALVPRRVLAWENLAADPTRFTFGEADAH